MLIMEVHAAGAVMSPPEELLVRVAVGRPVAVAPPPAQTPLPAEEHTS